MIAELLGDRYEPLEVIGAGGEGRVLRALDRQHDRLVALKVRSARTGTTRRDLMREARVLLSLEPHASLPLVRDDFFHEDEYVVVMDWIDGTDLGRLLAEQGTPGLAPSTVLRAVAQVAEALTFLHGHDPPVVHGDVKPANLVLTERRRVFEEAIRLGTATDPSRRPSSAGELVERLRAGWEADVPTGVVTVCMTDIEGSTDLWERHPGEMRAVLVRHDAIVAQAVEAHGGRLIESMGEGDSTVSIFTGAVTAARAAADLLSRMEAEPWPDDIRVRLRVGLHTGEVQERSDVRGPIAGRAARVRALADGGQVFLSEATAGLLAARLVDGFGLVDLGPHRLRGFVAGLENVYALSAPRLRVVPSPAECPYRGLLEFEWDDADLFFGRDEVLSDLLRRVAAGRFVAVVGASGSGKSSLVRAGVMA